LDVPSALTAPSASLPGRSQDEDSRSNWRRPKVPDFASLHPGYLLIVPAKAGECRDDVADGADLAETLDIKRYPRFDLPILELHSSAPNMMEYNKKKKPNIKTATPIPKSANHGKDFTPCSKTARKATKIPMIIMREKIAIGLRCFIWHLARYMARNE
jgi:hypothetical protein